jgi:hypothetical protein
MYFDMINTKFNILFQKVEARREFGRSEIAFVVKFLDQNSEPENLTPEDKQAAIKLIMEKLAENPLINEKRSKVLFTI